MHSPTEWLFTLSPTLVYLAVAGLVFAEDALFFGFVLPGESAAVIGGVIASQGHVDIVLMCSLVVLAAIVGDSVGYEVGRYFGPRLLDTKPLAARREPLERAQEFLRTRGGSAVFLGRFVAFFRAVMPALAGISRMTYPRFLVYNAIGGLVWGIGFVLLGYFAGNAYHSVATTVGRGVALAVALIAGILFVVWRIRRRRS